MFILFKLNLIIYSIFYLCIVLQLHQSINIFLTIFHILNAINLDDVLPAEICKTISNKLTVK